MGVDSGFSFVDRTRGLPRPVELGPSQVYSQENPPTGGTYGTIAEDNIFLSESVQIVPVVGEDDEAIIGCGDDLPSFF
jgi:hypothetical protein